MSIPFSAMVTFDGTISFTHIDGRVYNIMRNQPLYDNAIELVKRLSNFTPINLLTGEEITDHDLRMELYEISQPRKMIARSSDNRIVVEGDEVTFDGKPVDEVIAKRLLWMIEQGFDAEPLFKFLVLLSENPSYRAVNSLFGFMDSAKMAITHEGKILAYKRVREDFRDIHSKTFDNSVGQRVMMPRNEVNEDPRQTCSAGLHVCSINYLPHFGVGDGNRVVICEIHPKDVVAVPIDYGNAKMRVCEYLVVGEVENAEDILGTKAVMTFRDPTVYDDSEKDEDEDNQFDEDNFEDTIYEDDFEQIIEDALTEISDSPDYSNTETLSYRFSVVALNDLLGELELDGNESITPNSTFSELREAYISMRERR